MPPEFTNFDYPIESIRDKSMGWHSEMRNEMRNSPDDLNFWYERISKGFLIMSFGTDSAIDPDLLARAAIYVTMSVVDIWEEL